MIPPKVISEFALDSHLLARYGPARESRPDGRAWERAVSGLLYRPGLFRRQHAGTLGLFGAGSASGARHEIDGAGAGHREAAWIEAKARERLDKADVAVFDLKCFDLYRTACVDYPDATGAGSWWPLLVSSEPVTEAVRRVCVDLGVVLCEPERIPLLNLLRIASKPAADMHLSESSLSEFVGLAEPVIAPMQIRWRLDVGRGELRTLLQRLTARQIGDLLFLQDELSADFRDMLDVERPGHLERRAAALADRMTAAAV